MLVQRRKRHPGVNLVPMIDVLSFLLIFFMLFTSLRTTQAGISVNLPAAGQADANTETQITITVDSGGRMYTAEGPAQSSAVTQWVAEQLAQAPQLAVTIEADQKTDYQNVVTAIDAVRAAGVVRLQLAIEQEQDQLR